MKSIRSNLLALSLVLLLAQLPVLADPFPGKGSEQTWVQACNICNQGVQLMQMQRFAESIKYFEKAMELYAFDPVFPYDAGIAHQSCAYLVGTPAAKKSELERAEYYFDLSTKLKADKFDVWIHMANVQSELQEYEKSLKSLETALTIPGVPQTEKAKAQSAIAFVRSKLGTTNQVQQTASTAAIPAANASTTNTSLTNASMTNTSLTNTALTNTSSSAANGTSGQSSSNWQTYGNSSTAFTMRYPDGWQVSSDAKTGRIDVAHPSGAKLSVLPFAIAKILDTSNAADLMTAMLKEISPGDDWSKPALAGPNTYRATAANSKGSAAAALVVSTSPVGTFGKLCLAKLPKSAKQIDNNIFAEMLSHLQFNGMQQTASAQALAQAAAMQKMAAQQTSQPLAPDQQIRMMQQPQMWQGMNQSGLPPTPFVGYRTFVDPSEHSFEVEVPIGWQTEGGLTRVSAIDCRPWVKVTSPDQLITAFIGDGSIPPFSVPTLLGTQLGYGVGRSYGGGIVKPYIPANKFVQSYAREKLGKIISGLQIVEQHEHPDFAQQCNGTVGATRSECSSIKLTGNYKNVPAVGYFLAATKLTMQSGAGMWWVTYIAGELGAADRDAGGLSVILHMIKTFHLDPQWQGQSLNTTAQVSSQFRQASQIREKSMMDSYWSQQAFNDRMHQGYWDRQAVQDHAANNFSDYIRGTENVQDPQTGNQYKVQYGPQNHWIDPGGNVMGSNAGAPGPEWRQLMSVP